MASEKVYQPLNLETDTLGILIQKLDNNCAYLRETLLTGDSIASLRVQVEELQSRVEALEALIEEGGGGITGTGCKCCPYYQKEHEGSTGEDDS